MERRVLVTLIACTLFTLVYLKLNPVPQPQPQKDLGESSVEMQNPADPVSPGGAADDVARADEIGATSVGPIEIAPYESPLTRVDLTNLGAGLTQVELKQYTQRASDDATDPANWVLLFPESEGARALSIRALSADSTVKRGLDNVYWEVAKDETVRGTRTLVFRYETSDGLSIEKELTFHPDSYAIDVVLRTTTANSDRNFIGREYLLLGAGGVLDVPRGWFTDQVGAPSAVAMRGGKHGDYKVFRHAAKDLAEEPQVVNSAKWAGGTNLYFLALLEPLDDALEAGAELSAVSEDQPEEIRAELRVMLPFNRDGSTSSTPFRFYAGPKDPTLMKTQGFDSFLPIIEEDYGWSFRWVNKLLLSGLRFFHGFFGNWGVAIILLTLVVRLIAFPITRVQQVSMQRYSQKMQVLKPKLDKLKERHKNNPQKFAQEQMKLLKEHDAKPPLFGCLSMFITFPVFIAMFQLLRTSIELRQAPFVGWIHDLSLPDAMFGLPGVDFAFNLLPLLATAAFVVQMMLAPKPDDPVARQQQKMMTFMPMVFGVMFYGYAAGLSLYMLTTSIYSIFETQFIRKRFFPTPTTAAKPVAVN